MSGTYQVINLAGGGSATAVVYPDFASFPVIGSDGDLGIARDTGNLYYWNTSSVTWEVLASGGGGISYNPEPVLTLSGADISNKYIVLPTAPTNKNRTRLSVVGGPEQEYGIDFIVTTDDSDRRLSWDGLGLESLLEAGDKLIITYN